MMRPTFNRAFLVVLCAMGSLAAPLLGQQADIPPAVDGAVPEAAVGAEADRIVDGRPDLHGFKRGAHPFSWIEFAFRPLLQGAEKVGPSQFNPDPEKKPRVSGVRLSIRGIGGGGSSSGLGPEVRPFHYDLFGTGTEVELPLYVSFRLYESYGFRVNYPFIRSESFKRLGLELTGRYASRVAESFYGVGNDAPYWNETKFRSVSRTAGVALDARINDTWSFRLEEGYRSVGITEPRNGESVLDVFHGTDVPGLSEPGVTMLTSTASLERNTKDRVHLAGSGGLQRLEVTLNEALTGGDFSYWRYRGDIEQFFPLDKGKRNVIAFRGHVETTEEKGGSIIPFYDLPTIGGRSTVRGFSTRRFTDRSAMSAALEYRYRIWRYMDWGFFVDTGQVAEEIKDFARDRLHTGYGVRFMLRTKGERAVSLDVGHSREGWMFYVDFTPTF
ncbi:MAG TPA: BamA/TamA family outer membrane protein [Terriglobia bacterium]|nr:BamA/TamA family outer membrane protein [Terriglobia bacterium]